MSRFYDIFIIILYCSSSFGLKEILFSSSKGTFDGKYHLANSVARFTARSLLECQRHCVSEKKCISIFYNADKKDCILHNDPFVYTSPSEIGTGWKFYLNQDVTSRCPSDNGFMFYRELDLCFNVNPVVTIDFPAIKTRCNSLGGYPGELIRISSEERQKYIELVTASDQTKRICIQGTDTINPGTWTFDDGTPMTYSNWDVQNGEPEGGRGYLEIFNQYLWHDLPSTSSNPCLPICERR